MQSLLLQIYIKNLNMTWNVLKELKKWNELLIDDFLYYKKNVAFKKQIAP